MGTETPPLPELIAAWRETYDRTRVEMQDVSEPLLEWLCENGSACAPWMVEEVAALTATGQVIHPIVLSVLTGIDRHFRGEGAAS